MYLLETHQNMMDNFRFNRDDQLRSIEAYKGDADNLSLHRDAAAAALLNQGLSVASMANSSSNVGLLHLQNQNIINPSLSNEFFLRSLLMARDTGRPDQLGSAELVRKRMLFAEQQARFQLISSAANNMNSQALHNGMMPPSLLPAVVRDSVEISDDRGFRRVADSSWKNGPIQKKARTFIDPMITKLSESEKKASFPLPSLKETATRPRKVGKLSSFRKTWERLERQSDTMDDTTYDQDKFVVEFFQRSLHSYQSDHLKKRLTQFTKTNEQKKSNNMDLFRKQANVAEDLYPGSITCGSDHCFFTAE